MLQAFPPLLANNCHTIILGSMPGRKSLVEHEYYAHPYNVFWNILFNIYDEVPSESYEIREKLILQNGLGIWDVFMFCEREGSLDANIEHPIANDFETFFKQHPSIQRVVFNGKSPMNFYKKHVGDFYGKKVVALPSTSPTYANMRPPQKQMFWKEFFEAEVLAHSI